MDEMNEEIKTLVKGFTLADIYGQEKLKALFQIVLEKNKNNEKSLANLKSALEIKIEQWFKINRNSERLVLYENFLEQLNKN